VGGKPSAAKPDERDEGIKKWIHWRREEVSPSAQERSRGGASMMGRALLQPQHISEMRGSAKTYTIVTLLSPFWIMT
jgi:hypothetical protein